jgi:hypothetical protein
MAQQSQTDWRSWSLPYFAVSTVKDANLTCPPNEWLVRCEGRAGTSVGLSRRLLRDSGTMLSDCQRASTAALIVDEPLLDTHKPLFTRDDGPTTIVGNPLPPTLLMNF